jgi:hypothetical protein
MIVRRVSDRQLMPELLDTSSIITNAHVRQVSVCCVTTAKIYLNFWNKLLAYIKPVVCLIRKKIRTYGKTRLDLACCTFNHLKCILALTCHT